MKPWIGILILIALPLTLRADEDLTLLEEPSQTVDLVEAPTDSPLGYGLDIKYSPIKYDEYLIENNFASSTKGTGLTVAVEWLPFGKKVGKLGIGAGAGVNWIRDIGLPSGRTATVTTLPVELFLSYRADFKKNQIVVPFAKGGAEVAHVWQSSPNGADRPDTAYYYGFNTTLGLELCLNTFEPKTGDRMDARTGINTTYLVFEYVKSSFAKIGNANLARSEFRFGLRFEI